MNYDKMAKKKFKLNARDKINQLSISCATNPVHNPSFNYNQPQLDGKNLFISYKTNDENILDQTIGSNIIEDLVTKKKKSKKLAKTSSKRKNNDNEIINEMDLRSISLNSNEQKIKF
jgi:hypothetical protein